MDMRFVPIADHALLIEFDAPASDTVTQAVASLDLALGNAQIDGLIETVPAIVNLLVSFDPLRTDHDKITAAAKTCLSERSNVTRNSTQHSVGICYDPAFATDLAAVAAATGLSEDAVINAHLGGEYSVLMYGFAPGYAYLRGVPEALQVPRKPAAVRDVPAGSVVIAGPQCLITTLTMPTGWSVIGRSPAQVLRDDPDKPFLFDTADTVRFTRMSRDEFHAQSATPR